MRSHLSHYGKLYLTNFAAIFSSSSSVAIEKPLSLQATSCAVLRRSTEIAQQNGVEGNAVVGASPEKGVAWCGMCKPNRNSHPLTQPCTFSCVCRFIVSVTPCCSKLRSSALCDIVAQLDTGRGSVKRGFVLGVQTTHSERSAIS